MEQHQGKYVRDLKAWELPRLDDLEDKVVDELADRARAIYLDRDRFGEEFHTLFIDRLRELVGTAVGETIEYWVKGLVDGNDGRFPEFCVEFPYLERNENIDALTVAYCVDNEDGTRTELNRATLERSLMRLLENEATTELVKRRIKVVACELRALAQRLEAALTQERS
jgi:hypothetical protein